MEHGEQSTLAFEFERHLGYEGEVHFLAGQGGARGDKTRVAPHDLHNADSVQHAMRFHMGRVDHFLGLLDRGEVAKRTIHVLHVIVDGLGNSDHRNLELATLDFLNHTVGPALRPVAADREQDVDAALLQKIDNDVGADGPARSTAACLRAGECCSLSLSSTTWAGWKLPPRIRRSRSRLPVPRVPRSDNAVERKPTG